MNIDEMLEYHEWLESLKAGDTVVEESPGWPTRYYVKTVGRVTNTQVIVGDVRYRKKDGRKIGEVSSYGGAHKIVRPTPEMLDKARRQDLVQSISLVRSHDLEDVPTEQLEIAAKALGRKI